MFGEIVTRFRAGGVIGEDPYGNPEFGPDTEVNLPGAAFDPGGSIEPVEVGRAQTVTTPKLYFTVETDVVSTDRLRVRGDLYSVVGRPARWASPFRAVDAGLTVELKLVEG